MVFAAHVLFEAQEINIKGYVIIIRGKVIADEDPKPR